MRNNNLTYLKYTGILVIPTVLFTQMGWENGISEMNVVV